MDKEEKTPIRWPKPMAAERDMVYESLTLLKRLTRDICMSETFTFLVSCSRHSLLKNNDVRGIYHMIDVVERSGFNTADIAVTHEILPRLESSAQIVDVTQELRVACFDSGCVVPVKNLSGKVNMDVRGRLAHHSGQIVCLATNENRNRLASGCTSGEITLYRAWGEKLEFISRTTDPNASFITAMSFIEPIPGLGIHLNDTWTHSTDRDPSHSENVLLYTTNSGRVCLLDARCGFAENIERHVILTTEPRVSLTSMVCPTLCSGNPVYLGGARGEILGFDLRKPGQYFYERKPEAGDGPIRGMKEVTGQVRHGNKAFLAYSNSTKELQIFDLRTMEPERAWICDRESDGPIRDLIQVGGRIVTCGDSCSIGCWRWDISKLDHDLWPDDYRV